MYSFQNHLLGGLLVATLSGCSSPFLESPVSPRELMDLLEPIGEEACDEVARAAIKDKVAQLGILKAIAAKSKLTEKDATAIARKINKAMHERHKKDE